MWNNGGMILTVENRRSRRKTRAGATLYTTNPIWNGLESNPGLSEKRPVTNRLIRHPVHFLFDKEAFT